MAGLTLVTPPTIEPITLADAKAHLRVDDDDNDATITGYIAAARSQAEAFTARALLTQTYEYRIDWGFPAEIRLPIGPVASITSIAYIDDQGNSAAVASSDYQAALKRETAVIRPAYSMTWPTGRCVLDAITVTFVAGETAAASLPASVIQAMKLLIGHWYENREAVVVGTIASELPIGVKNLLMPWVRAG